MVTFTREHSPYYRELYADLPPEVANTAQLPVTRKRDLMQDFDRWVTDRDVTYDALAAFLDDPEAVAIVSQAATWCVRRPARAGTAGCS